MFVEDIKIFVMLVNFEPATQLGKVINRLLTLVYKLGINSKQFMFFAFLLLITAKKGTAQQKEIPFKTVRRKGESTEKEHGE